MRADTEAMRRGHRSAEDDFFCEKYQVWYPREDCNYRVVHRTFEGCVGCFQGRVNLRPVAVGPAGDPRAVPAPVIPFPLLRHAGERPERLPGALPPKR